MKQALYTGKRFRAAVRVFLVGKVAQGIANFALTLWIVRLFAPDDYGAYMAIWGVVELLVPLSSFGLLEAVRRFMPDLASRGSVTGVRVFVKWMTFARFTIIFAWVGGIWATWPWFTAWLGFNPAQSEQANVLPLLLVTVLGFRFTSEILETLLEQRWSQLAQALQPLGRLAGMVILVLSDAVSLAHVLWVDIAVSSFCLLLAEFALLRRLHALELNGTYRVCAREVMNFAWHMAGTNLLAATASMGVLRLLAVRLLGLEAAGLFAFLQQLNIIASRYMPAQLLVNIIRPMLISRRAAGDMGAVKGGVSLMMKSNLLIVLVLLVVFGVAGDNIIALASGGRFPDAGLTMLLFFIALGATSQGQLITMTMQIFDQTRQLRAQSLLYLLVPLAAWFAGEWGLSAMVAGIALSHWLRNLYTFWWIERHGAGRLLDMVGSVRGMVAAGLVLLFGWLLLPLVGSWVALALTLVCLALGWWFAKPLSRDDEAFLAQILRGKVSLVKPYVYTR